MNSLARQTWPGLSFYGCILRNAKTLCTRGHNGEIIDYVFSSGLCVLNLIDERSGRRIEKMSNNKLFVGNLSYSVTNDKLQELFGQYGPIVSCNVATDRDTGRSRGFGFVEMQTQADAEGAIAGLNGQDVGGRQISVSISQPKPRRTGGRY